MSSAVDNDTSTTFSSYVPFAASTPRRRTSAPKEPARRKNSLHAVEKADRYTNSHLPASPAGAISSMQEKYAASTVWMNQGQRARYVKTGCLVTLVLLLLYYIAPGRYAAVPGVGKYPGGDVAGDPTLGTAKCTRSSSNNKPLIQYALMIDAGSTGSRIHVYRFNNCGPTPELESEVFEMTAKREGGSGLSSYKGDAQGAAQSLDVLMDVAVRNVPDALKGCTPVAVKATAGLRKLGPEMSEAILEAVRTRLETVYPFPVVAADKGGVEVMDGKDEGVYAWITTNYLLGKIGGPDKTPTAAVFDLGGGSTQIVFEPTFKQTSGSVVPETLAAGEHKYELSFGGRAFTLYQHSYLGYGLMAARENLHKLLVTNTHAAHPDSTAWLAYPIQNPCIAPGQTRSVDITLDATHPLGAHLTVNMTGPATGSAALCRALAEATLAKDAACVLAPCAFAGVHQPSLAATFARDDVYLFSYFYDRTAALGMPSSFTLRELGELTARVCAGADAGGGAWGGFGAVPGALDELRDRPETCLDLNFMLALLHTGYEMPLEREVRVAKRIGGNELGWCLGASLPLLGGEAGWACRVSQVA